jgi:hypothetical protein
MEHLSNELISLRTKLQLRDEQIAQIMRLHLLHKGKLQEAANTVAKGQLTDLGPSVLLPLNNSFRLDFVKLIVSFDSIEATYLLQFALADITSQFGRHA